MNDVINIHRSDHRDDEFERLVRARMQSLAQHAPATVRQLDEIIVDLAPNGDGRRGQRRRAAGIGATIAALVGAVGITTVALNGAGSGGAGTPTEAVLVFVDALQHEDVLGMIDVIDPTEVPALRAAAEQGAAEAQRIDLLDSGFSLEGVQGVDIAVTDLALTSEQLTDDVAMVSAASGTVSASFDPATFPFGATFREVIGEPTPASSTTTLGPEGRDFRVATVQRNGRWFVSLSYTIAEYARRRADADLPAQAPIASEGFDSAQAAGTAFYQRLAALDLAGVVATSAPGEGDAMLRYAPLWLPTSSGATDSARAEGLDLRLTSIAFDETGDDERRTLQATRFVVDGTIPSDSVGDGTIPSDTVPGTVDDQAPPLALHVERAEGCTTWSGPAAVSLDIGIGPWIGFERLGPEVFRSCEPAPFGVMQFLFVAGGGVTELPDLVTVQIDGRWHVSPLGTVAGSLVDVLRDVRDSGSLFDSVLAPYLFGTSRAMLEMMYVGRADVQMPSECVALFTYDATGTITGVVDSPPISMLQSCNWMEVTESVEVTGSGTVVPPSATINEVEVPVSIVMPETTAGG